MSSSIRSRQSDRATTITGYQLDRNRSRPLATAEQQRLAALYSQTRDPRIEHKLVEANLLLVIKIARQLSRTHAHQLEDLVQEGTLGLIQAIRKYRPSKGAHLSTYAGIWIRAFVMKHIMDNVRIVRAVRTRDQRAAFFRGVIDVSEVSFDAPRRRGMSPLGDRMADDAPAIDEIVETAELVSRLREETARLKARLPAREMAILEERVLADEPRSLSFVGRRLSLSGERVRQIEGKLRAAIESGVGWGGEEIAA